MSLSRRSRKSTRSMRGGRMKWLDPHAGCCRTKRVSMRVKRHAKRNQSRRERLDAQAEIRRQLAE